MKRWIGLILMAIGVLGLCLDFSLSLSRLNINALFIVPLLLLFAGLVVHVFILKKDSKY